MTWRFSTQLDEAITATLEESFLEADFSPWMLQQNEPGDPWFLSGYFPERSEGETAWNELKEIFPELGEATVTELADQDWQTQYQQFLQPWHHAPLHWIPRWMEPEYDASAHAGEAVLYLEAGMAFGTGTHETTQLCGTYLVDFLAAWGDRSPRPRIVDAGCGSGILALSAAALGERNLMGFDTDPDALIVAEENAAHHGLGGIIPWQHGGLDDYLPAGEADLLMANIQADVLTRFSHTLTAAVRPQGSLVLSGILQREHEKVAAHFRETLSARGINFTETIRHAGDWSGLRYQYG